VVVVDVSDSRAGLFRADAHSVFEGAFVKAASKAAGCFAALAAALFAVSVTRAVAGGPAGDSKPAGEGRVPSLSGKSHAPSIYRCTLTLARSWDANEFVTTTRYSDKRCSAGEVQSVVDVVQSVVEHYKPVVSHGGSVPSVH
jgi:hypothetical protein